MNRAYKSFVIFIAAAIIIVTFAFSTFGCIFSNASVNAFSDASDTYSSDDMNERLKNTVILYEGSSIAYVNGAKTVIDKLNPDIVPIAKDSTVLIPVRFISESLGGNVGWDGKTYTVDIFLDGKTIKLKQGSNIMTLDDGTINKLAYPVEAIGGRTYAPLHDFVEALGEKIVKKGDLIIITAKENTPDFLEDEKFISFLAASMRQLPVVGSYKKLVELLGTGEENQVLYAEKSMSIAVAGAANRTAESSSPAADMGSKASLSEPEASRDLSYKASEDDYSGTNIQVEGVDEADMVKTDGEYIYQVNGERVAIIKAYPAEEMKVESIINFSKDDFNPSEIYIYNDGQGDKLVVIGNSHAERILGEDQVNIRKDTSTTVEGEVNVKIRIYPPQYYYRETVKALVFDITDKSNAKKLKEVDIDGYYVSSRMIGPYLYIVTNKYIDHYRIMKGNTIENENLGLLPSYRDSSAGEEFIDIDYKSIHYFPGYVQPNYLIITGIDVNDANKEARVSAYLGSGQNIYVSRKNLYVSVTGYTWDAGGMGTEEKTMVYKFALDEGNAVYQGKGEVPGRLLNQFSMDEFENYFRIATTSGQIWRNDEFTSKNNIYVLNEMLEITGEIEDIAPGEQIYSVRFMGNRAYMVTFRTVDPLFVIDLEDPKAPKILGALKIPGYSDYLHPYDENHIIGFGKDTVEIKGQAYYLGMKIALFDITDVSNPVQKFSEIIGDRGTESEILRNHKALLLSKEKGLMAFPVTVMEIKGENKYNSSEFPEYGQFSFQGAYVYEVDIEKGFTLKGRITHLTGDDYLKAGQGWYQNNKNVNRILYIKDVLYTLSNSMVKANGLAELEERNQVIIPVN